MSESLFLTSVYLDDPVISRPRRRGDLSDLGTIHRFVMNLFGDLPDDTQPRAAGGILFRAETLRHRPHVLIQSSFRPDSDIPLRVTDASVVLDTLKNHDHVRLRLAVNPVQRVSKTKADRPIPADQIENWLRKKLEPGFSIEHIVELHSGTAKVNKSTIATADLDCVARIVDIDQAQRMIVQGVGRRKSHGCGLISVVPTEWQPDTVS